MAFVTACVLCFVQIGAIPVVAQPAGGQANGQLITPLRVSPVWIGVGATAGLNLYSMNIPVYNGSSFCGTFSSATSVRPNVFVAMEVPLNSNGDWNGWWLFPRLHFNMLSATATSPSANSGDARAPDSSLVPVTLQNKMVASLSEAGADLFVSYQFSSMFKIFGGPTVGMLLAPSVTETENITSPADAVFLDTHNGTRALTNGTEPAWNNFFATVTLGGGMNVPLGHWTRLTPELTFSYPLTSVWSNFSWHIMALRLGTGIEFNVAPAPKKAVPVVVPPPPIVKKHSLQASVKIAGVQLDPNGAETNTEMAVPSIRIEEFVRRQAFPLLNFVFFSEGSADIPDRYYLFSDKTGAESFSLNSLAGQPVLKAYYHTLNVIGRRMLDRPNAKLTLIGSNANVGVELNAERLSMARATAVKNYFVNVWGIDPARIATQAVNLPRAASPEGTKEGQEENRRVEIVSDDPAVLDPVATEAVERTMNPPVLRVRTSIQSSSETVSDLSLVQNGKVLKAFGDAQPAQEWKPDPLEVPTAQQPLVAELHVINNDGDSTTVRDSSMVQQITIQKKREEKINDKIIERYSLITFDFDKSDLDARSRRTIQMLSQNVTAKDEIRVTGYTDLIGEANHNQLLSSERAENVRTALKSETSTKAPAIVAAGEGEKNLVDNTLPEGRFLSRTVNITIERPVSGQ